MWLVIVISVVCRVFEICPEGRELINHVVLQLEVNLDTAFLDFETDAFEIRLEDLVLSPISFDGAILPQQVVLLECVHATIHRWK